MIVAMVAVRVMQVTIDEVINMVAVRDGFMSAIGSVNVIAIVSVTGVIGRTGNRILA
jgi:hypothetical protein